MRKSICVMLSLILAFSLVACKEVQKTTTPTNASTVAPFSEYVGVWSEQELSYEMGGLILDVAMEADQMKVSCSLTQSAPACRVAEFSSLIPLSDIQNNTVKLNFDNDGWGNKGSLELTFANGYILADFTNIQADELANWGFYEQTYKLIPNANAHTILEQGSAQAYEEDAAEESTYDTSKASGILAKKGMKSQIELTS